MIYFQWALYSVFGWLLPWWWVVVPLLAIGAYMKSLKAVLMQSFLGLPPVWMALALYFDMNSHGLISQRMTGLLGLPHPLLTYGVVGLIAGLVSVSTMLSGYYVLGNLKGSWRKELPVADPLQRSS